MIVTNQAERRAERTEITGKDAFRRTAFDRGHRTFRGGTARIMHRTQRYVDTVIVGVAVRQHLFAHAKVGGRLDHKGLTNRIPGLRIKRRNLRLGVIGITLRDNGW